MFSTILEPVFITWATFSLLSANLDKCKLLTFANKLRVKTNLDSSRLKEFADYNFKFDENWRNFFKQVEKTLWEKEKLLVTSNFAFSHSVFKRLALQTCKNQGLFGKGLKKCIQTIHTSVTRVTLTEVLAVACLDTSSIDVTYIGFSTVRWCTTYAVSNKARITLTIPS